MDANHDLVAGARVDLDVQPQFGDPAIERVTGPVGMGATQN